jgi:hypothetical protein
VRAQLPPPQLPHTNRTARGQVRAIIETFPSVRHIVASGDVKQALDGAHPMAHTLFQWIVTSNRTFIVRLPDSKRIERIPCRHQFLMKSATQEKEAKFQALKALHKKTVFAFHGSGMECWYVVQADCTALLLPACWPF